jgi:hypothetical protein
VGVGVRCYGRFVMAFGSVGRRLRDPLSELLDLHIPSLFLDDRRRVYFT